jgi:hypothetical protein
MSAGPVQKRAIDYFRRLVALIYREIGVLKSANHPDIAKKALLQGGFFGADRKEKAKQIYRLTLTDSTRDQIVARYVKQTGLTLHDVAEAFEAGHWPGAAFGGPKWGKIVRFTIELGSAIQNGTWDNAERLLVEIDKLEHNTGRIVSKFVQLN